MLILLGMIIVICLIFGIYTILYNKMQDYIIRINEVESMIDNNLRNKYDNINKCVSIIKGNNELENVVDHKIFDEIIRLRTKKISNFDLDRKLVDAENSLIQLKEKYQLLKENEEIDAISKKLDEIDEDLIAGIEYYNRNIAEYNKLIKLFPTNIIAKIGKYQEKLFFDRKDIYYFFKDFEIISFKKEKINTKVHDKEKIVWECVFRKKY